MGRRKQIWIYNRALGTSIKLSVHARNRFIERLEVDSWDECESFVRKLVINAKPVIGYTTRDRAKLLGPLSSAKALAAGDWVLAMNPDQMVITTAFPARNIRYK